MKHQYFTTYQLKLLTTNLKDLSFPARIINRINYAIYNIPSYESNRQIATLSDYLKVSYAFENRDSDDYYIQRLTYTISVKTVNDLHKVLTIYGLKPFTQDELIEIYNYEYVNNKWFLFKDKIDTQWIDHDKNWSELLYSQEQATKNIKH